MEKLGGGGGFIFFKYSPLFGEDSHFDEHIFQWGWFNHQLSKTKRMRMRGLCFIRGVYIWLGIYTCRYITMQLFVMPRICVYIYVLIHRYVYKNIIYVLIYRYIYVCKYINIYIYTYIFYIHYNVFCVFYHLHPVGISQFPKKCRMRFLWCKRFWLRRSAGYFPRTVIWTLGVFFINFQEDPNIPLEHTPAIPKPPNEGKSFINC